MPQESDNEQRLLKNARREGILIMAVWAVALVWSVGAGYVFGYNRDANSIRLIAGIPDWVLASIVVPWVLCFGFTTWFCFFYMADDDLGQDRAEGDRHG